VAGMQKEPAAERERYDGSDRCGEETATVLEELRHATQAWRRSSHVSVPS